ncbi:MAG: hypothetical protein LUC44_00715, partial [Prevotellaceae bacterium]|nr:hypothetical protein [Prevotellaceae bacterium]
MRKRRECLFLLMALLAFAVPVFAQKPVKKPVKTTTTTTTTTTQSGTPSTTTPSKPTVQVSSPT